MNLQINCMNSQTSVQQPIVSHAGEHSLLICGKALGGRLGRSVENNRRLEKLVGKNATGGPLSELIFAIANKLIAQ
jgi:hypothetical protein